MLRIDLLKCAHVNISHLSMHVNDFRTHPFSSPSELVLIMKSLLNASVAQAIDRPKERFLNKEGNMRLVFR